MGVTTVKSKQQPAYWQNISSGWENDEVTQFSNSLYLILLFCLSVCCKRVTVVIKFCEKVENSQLAGFI